MTRLRLVGVHKTPEGMWEIIQVINNKILVTVTEESQVEAWATLRVYLDWRGR